LQELPTITANRVAARQSLPASTFPGSAWERGDKGCPTLWCRRPAYTGAGWIFPRTFSRETRTQTRIFPSTRSRHGGRSSGARHAQRTC